MFRRMPNLIYQAIGYLMALDSFGRIRKKELLKIIHNKK